jgi:hypothetical protein
LARARANEITHQITPIESSTTMKQIRPLTLLLASMSAALPAWAHEGHGMPGFAHWHASDVLGFVAIAAVIGAVIWFKGGK